MISEILGVEPPELEALLVADGDWEDAPRDNARPYPLGLPYFTRTVLPPALVLPERHWLRRLTLLISCAQTLSLTFFKQAYILNYFAMTLVPALYVLRQVRRERAEAPSTASPQVAPSS